MTLHCFLAKIAQILEKVFLGVRAKKLPKEGRFMDAKSVRKTLKIFNLTTANRR